LKNCARCFGIYDEKIEKNKWNLCPSCFKICRNSYDLYSDIINVLNDPKYEPIIRNIEPLQVSEKIINLKITLRNKPRPVLNEISIEIDFFIFLSNAILKILKKNPDLTKSKILYEAWRTCRANEEYYDYCVVLLKKNIPSEKKNTEERLVKFRELKLELQDRIKSNLESIFDTLLKEGVIEIVKIGTKKRFRTNIEKYFNKKNHQIKI